MCVGEGGCCCFIVCGTLSGEIWHECAGLWVQWMWKEVPVSHSGRAHCACLDCYPVLQPRLYIFLLYMCCTYHYCAVSPSLMQIILASTHVLFSAPSFACCHSTLFLPISFPQLWPLFEGQMVKPQKNKLLYISQVHWLMELVQLGIVNAKE